MTTRLENITAKNVTLVSLLQYMDTQQQRVKTLETSSKFTEAEAVLNETLESIKSKKEIADAIYDDGIPSLGRNSKPALRRAVSELKQNTGTIEGIENVMLDNLSALREKIAGASIKTPYLALPEQLESQNLEQLQAPLNQVLQQIKRPYLALLEQLESQNLEQLHAPLNQVLKQIKLLHASNPTDETTLTNILEQTARVLNGRLSPAEYIKLAENTSGKSSPGMKILGGLMLVLGLAVIAVGFGVPGFIGGSALALAGVGFFAAGRQTGLSKAISHLAEAKIIEEKTAGAQA